MATTHKHVFDLHPEDDVYWCSADVGWITGHSYIVYGPLLNGATSVMWEGGPDYPDKDIWWEVCERYGVTIFYTAPTAIRACIKWGAEYPEKHDLSKLRLLGLGGRADQPEGVALVPRGHRRRALPDRRHVVADRDGPHHDLAAAGDHRDQAGQRDRAVPGCRGRHRRRGRQRARRRRPGLLVLKRPWPGMLRTLYGDDDRYVETYWKRFGKETYLVGDAAREDKDGYLWVIGRIDDVLNVSGHRMSTAEIESAIVSHGTVAESAVVGQYDEDSGQSVTAFVTLEGDREGTDELVDEIREHVAKRIGKPGPAQAHHLGRRPAQDASGKIMRRLLRDIAEGRELGDVTTLRDPTSCPSWRARSRSARRTRTSRDSKSPRAISKNRSMRWVVDAMT